MEEPRPDRVALCLSGGGYRAALFHLGALRRLEELGVLSRVDAFSCVSGGSILAAILIAHVRAWPRSGRIPEIHGAVADEVRELTRRNIRTTWVLRRLLRPWDSTVAVESLHRRYRAITGKTLVEVGAEIRPDFVFSAADMAFGANWVSQANRVGSYQAGYASPAPPSWTVARAVAASSCFPPAFAPMPIRMDPSELRGGKALRLAEARPEEEGRAAAVARRNELVRGLRLSDGGLYDNMGLEPVDHFERILVSDGGATFDFKPDGGMLGRLGRYQAIQGRQVGAMRTRWLMDRYECEGEGELHREGTYWGIATHVDGSPYPEWLVQDVIAEVRTDLDRFSEAESNVLQNHGYLVADHRLRSKQPDLCDPGAPAPSPPFPGRWLDPEVVRRELADSSRRKLFGRWR